jgi:hypothetical protein
VGLAIFDDESKRDELVKGKRKIGVSASIWLNMTMDSRGRRENKAIPQPSAEQLDTVVTC